MLLAGGFASRRMTRALLSEALREALALSGALFALLVAATTFTLVVRVMGTDRLLTDAITALPGGQTAAVAAVLGLVMLCALAPFLAAQALVMALVLALPMLTHLLDPAPQARPTPTLSDDEVRRQLDQLAPLLPPAAPRLD